MKPADNISKLMKQSHVATDPQTDHRILADALADMEKLTEKHSAAEQARIWKIIPEKRMTKFAAAAVMVIAVSVGVIQWLPNGEVNNRVPAALAQMSVVQLLEMHLGQTQTSFDSETVVAAVKMALDKLSASEILTIAKKYGGQGEIHRDLSGRGRAGPPPTVSGVIRASDFVVHARVDAVTLDVNDIKAAILKKELDKHWFEHRGARIKSEVQLHVFEGYPSFPPLDSEKLLLRPILHTGRLGVLEKGKEYLIALQREGDTISMLPALRGPQGVYPIAGDSSMVSELRNGSMQLEAAWRFMKGLYDVINRGSQPSGEVQDYWLSKLQSDGLTDCWTAVEYFNATDEPPVAGEQVMKAIERQFDTILKDYRRIGYLLRDKLLIQPQTVFLKDALGLLNKVADSSAVERMLVLYEKAWAARVEDGHDRSMLNEGMSGADWTFCRKMVSLAAKHPGVKRKERILRVLDSTEEIGLTSAVEELGWIKGEDIDRLLLDMLESPTSFRISYAHDLRGVWNALARRGHPEIGPYLKGLIADPQNTDLGVQHYENNPREAVRFARKALKLLAQDTTPRK
jgi:hypothetical protein